MMIQDKIKERYNVIHQHFNFKDFLGLSALIFGLLLSNTSLQKNTANASEIVPNEKIETIKKVAPVARKSKKATAIKKKLRKHRKKKRVTAAHKKK